MMKISPAAKVGVVTVLGLSLSVAAIGWLTQFRLQPKGTRFTVLYTDVNGLLPGANVMLMGVRIGRVTTVQPMARTVEVAVEIPDPGPSILKGSRFKILTKGIVGEKNLEIFPPIQGHEVLQSGETVRGEDPARLEFAIDKAQDALSALEKTAKAADFQKRLNRVATRLEGAFNGVEHLTKNLDDLILQASGVVSQASDVAKSLSPEDIRSISHDLRLLSRGLRQTYETTLGTPETAENARKTLANIKSLSDKLEGMASSIEKLSTDPTVKQNLDDVVQSSRSVINLIGRSRVDRPFSPHLTINAISENRGSILASDFGLRLNFPNSFFNAGIEELGEQNLWDFIWGRPYLFNDKTGYHIGMIRSKIGGGIDYTPDRTLTLTGQFFNPLQPEIRLGLTYFPPALDNKYGLFGAWQRALMSGDSRMIFGIQWRPLD